MIEYVQDNKREQKLIPLEATDIVDVNSCPVEAWKAALRPKKSLIMVSSLTKMRKMSHEAKSGLF